MAASTAPASKSGLYPDPREDWLAQHTEEIIDPARPIVDPHHHLWDRGGLRYMIEEMAADVASGHNIIATVYVDCRSMYRASGPEAVPGPSARSSSPTVSGRDGGERRLRQGCDLRRHRQPRQPPARRRCEGRAGGGGSLPATGASAASATPRRGMRTPMSPACMRRGQKDCCSTALSARALPASPPLGLSFDAWLFHPQIGELTDLARAFPDTRIVLDHCGGPIGIGSYAGRREEIFPVWKASIQEIAKCENVVVKLGGLAMCLLGYDFHLRPKPPSSDEAAAAWRPYIETCIEAFGPNRCMFESNFPPDKGQCGHQVIFNAFKRLAAQYSEAEKTALFSKTATEFYRLKLERPRPA